MRLCQTGAGPVSLLSMLLASVGSEWQLVSAAPPTIQQVIEGLSRIENDIFQSSSFFIQYERDEVKDLFDSVASGGLLPAQWTQAYKGGQWLNTRRFTRPFKGKRIEVPAKPMTLLLKEQTVLNWDQSADTADINRAQGNINVYNGLNYTANLSLDVPRLLAEAGNIDLTSVRKLNPTETDRPFLPEYLRSNRSKYRVLPSQEEIAGVKCWIVDWPGMDRIAVSAERGFALIRRAYSWAPGKPLRVEVTNIEHREVRPGLWLPFQQVEIRYANLLSEKIDDWGRPACRARYTVQHIRFDDLGDSYFQVKLPAKTRVYDDIRGFRYSVGGDHADPFFGAISAAMEQQRAATKRRWLNGAIVAGAFIMVNLIVFRKFRLGKRSHASNPRA